MSASPDAASSLGTAGAERAAGTERSASTTAVGRGDGPGEIDGGALPRIFGDYTLLDRLASGGMGQVYRAARREAGPGAPPVAIKRVLPELAADADFLARFVSEARIARTLDHPNIVRVLEHGELGGEHYLVMEFIDGADLAALLAACARRALPLPLPAALTIAVAMARGLGAAHRRRVGEQPAPVVHRDISPQNVLVARDGTVKVTDFGIAQAAEKAVRTRSGVVIGRCRYMSPEQARGAAVDPRSDVFSAAVVLFEMLAGRPLFPGNSAEQILRQVASAALPQPREALPDCPPALTGLLTEALDRDPERRHADGAVLAAALEQVQRDEAPHYGAEDLGRLVQALAPHQPGAAAAATLGAAQDAAPAPWSATTAAAAPPLAPAREGKPPRAASTDWALAHPDPQAPTLLLEASSGPPPSVGGGRGWPPRGAADRRGLRAPWRWRGTGLVVTAALLGAAAGLWIGSRRAPEVARVAGPSGSAELGGEGLTGPQWRVAVRRVLAAAKGDLPPGRRAAPAVVAFEVSITRDGRPLPDAVRWLYLRRGREGARVTPLWTTAGGAGPIAAFPTPPGDGALSLGLRAPDPGGSELAAPRSR